MIVMPRRSVTRFFIPLIDVLLLLFVIFLLMPFANLNELEEKRQTAGDLTDTVDNLERELQRRVQEVRNLEDARVSADELEKLRTELEKLRQAANQPLHKRTTIHIIDIDGKTGAISYYDAARPDQPLIKLSDEKTVRALIERHQRDAEKRELYYLFLYPRPETGFPSLAQERRYQAWFEKVEHSLKEAP
jgi:benzoyl-CoA reductase/2-hydroxyglutaryl-CoA dehydratase subunit BcrC/BadD/HgdB